MKTNTIKKIELQKEINLLPNNKLSEVKKYIDSLFEREHIKKPAKKNLKGVWKGLGFEKIPNLEKEIRRARKELSIQE